MAIHVAGIDALSDARVLTGASANTVHATIGPVEVGGTYEVFALIGASDTAAEWEVQHRNADNSATLESWRIRSFVSGTTPIVLLMDLAKGERIRVVNLISFGGAVPIGAPVNIGTAANTTGTTLTVTVGVAGVPAGTTIFVATSSAAPDLTGEPSCSDSVNGSYTRDLFGQTLSGRNETWVIPIQ